MAWPLNLRTASQMILALLLHNQGEGCKCSLAVDQRDSKVKTWQTLEDPLKLASCSAKVLRSMSRPHPTLKRLQAST